MSPQGEENKGVELTGVRGTAGGGRGALKGSDFQVVKIGLVAVGRIKGPRRETGARGPAHLLTLSECKAVVP